jgi:hypothetical protein
MLQNSKKEVLEKFQENDTGGTNGRLFELRNKSGRQETGTYNQYDREPDCVLGV